MAFSFTMDGGSIALKTPEQIDTMIEFLRLYKTLTVNNGQAATNNTTLPTVMTPLATATTNEPPHPLIPAPGQRISDFAYSVLKDTEAGLHSRDLAKAMLVIGWVSRSSNPVEQELAVNTALLRYKDRFAKLPNGVWTVIGVHTPQVEAPIENPAPLPVASVDTEGDALTLASP